jgi:site-specific DNA-methyltransferase (adenine-specific)
VDESGAPQKIEVWVNPSGAVLKERSKGLEDDEARGNGSHRASFSEELVRIPILATTPPGGIVLDPFNGSGTSMVFAKRRGFRAVGIDLSQDYCEQCVASLRETQPLAEV